MDLYWTYRLRFLSVQVATWVPLQNQSEIYYIGILSRELGGRQKVGDLNQRKEL